MENVFYPASMEAMQEGNLAIAVPASTALQQVAVSEIGEFTAALINRGSAVYGQRYDLASDEQTGPQYAEILAETLGKPVSFYALDPDVFRSWSEDMALMFEWFETTGYSADIAGLRTEFPEVNWKGFQNWATEQTWN